MPLIFDGHLDLAWNATAYGRDLTLPIDATRLREAAMTDRVPACVSLPAMRRAGLCCCHATLFARSRSDATPADCLLRTASDSPTRAAAHAAAVAQLGYYRLLERQGHARILTDAATLDHHRQTAQSPSTRAADARALGCILLMEGADPITEPAELAFWVQQGVRAVGLAHYGPSAYAGGTPGTASTIGLTADGRELLQHMQDHNVVLDLSHLSDRSLFEALDTFGGRVIASHSNARHLCDNERQITDQQIRLIADRGGVVGIVLHNGMLTTGWRTGQSPRTQVTLRRAVEHIDHICQLVGDAAHVAIGSDLDGGFGTEACPDDLDTIEDLPKLAPLLAERSFSAADIAGVFHNNWIRFWRETFAPPTEPAPPSPAGM